MRSRASPAIGSVPASGLLRIPPGRGKRERGDDWLLADQGCGQGVGGAKTRAYRISERRASITPQDREERPLWHGLHEGRLGRMRPVRAGVETPRLPR